MGAGSSSQAPTGLIDGSRDRIDPSDDDDSSWKRTAKGNLFKLKPDTKKLWLRKFSEATHVSTGLCVDDEDAVEEATAVTSSEDDAKPPPTPPPPPPEKYRLIPATPPLPAVPPPEKIRAPEDGSRCGRLWPAPRYEAIVRSLMQDGAANFSSLTATDRVVWHGELSGQLLRVPTTRSEHRLAQRVIEPAVERVIDRMVPLDDIVVVERRVDKPIYKHVRKQRTVRKQLDRIKWEREYVTRDVERIVEKVTEREVERLVEAPVILKTVTVVKRVPRYVEDIRYVDVVVPVPVRKEVVKYKEVPVEVERVVEKVVEVEKEVERVMEVPRQHFVDVEVIVEVEKEVIVDVEEVRACVDVAHKPLAAKNWLSRPDWLASRRPRATQPPALPRFAPVPRTTSAL